MLRTALRPRWLALLGVVLLLATGMSLLGRWQLDRARVHGAQKAERSQAAAKPIETVLPPRVTFPKSADGARVTATGQWDGAQQLLVAGRERGGRTGFWLLVPLRLADGSAVGVVRGWVASPDDPAAVAPAETATVRVTGLLQPTEPPVGRAPGEGTGLPAGQLDAIAITSLVDAWQPYPLITGYVLAQQEQTEDGAALAGPVPQRVPAPAAETGLDWRNLGYAVQWWLFAAFGVFMWWRIVKDDHEHGAQAPASPATSPPNRAAADSAASPGVEPAPPVGEDKTDQRKDEPLARGVSS